MKTNINENLWDFSKLVLSKANEYIKKNKIIWETVVHIKHTVDTFNYVEGFKGYSGTVNYIEKKTWKNKNKFIEEEIKTTAEFISISELLATKRGVNTEQANQWLLSYSTKLVDMVLESPSDSAIADQFNTFVNDIEQNPVEYSVNVWLDGIWLESESFNLGDGVYIRRLCPIDIEEEIPASIAYYITPIRQFELGSAVLFFKYRTKDTKDIFIEIESILNRLRLFKLGSVIAKKYDVVAKSFLAGKTYLNSDSRVFALYKYGLKNADSADWIKFQSIMKDKIPKDSAGNPTILGTDHSSIALTRYKEAIIFNRSVENRITSSITSLEALFLKPKERMELSHRLSQRVSLMLGFFGFKPIEVYRNLMRAYEIRSTFVHGGAIPKEERSESVELFKKIVNYVRISQIIFFQIENKIDKENLINKLDNALLDGDALEKTKLIFRDIFVTI